MTRSWRLSSSSQSVAECARDSIAKANAFFNQRENSTAFVNFVSLSRVKRDDNGVDDGVERSHARVSNVVRETRWNRRRGRRFSERTRRES